MSSPRLRQIAIALLLLAGWGLCGGSAKHAMAWAEDHGESLTRKVKTRVSPVYPDIARRMSIVGTVRVMVVVTPGGAIKSAKVVGGHPLLVNAAMDALKRWRFEPAADESTGVVEFRFEPQQ